MKITYTLKVPETVSLADLTADSISKPKDEEKSEDDWWSWFWVAAYEFQSANNDDDVDVDWLVEDSSVPVNHACAAFIFDPLVFSVELGGKWGNTLK